MATDNASFLVYLLLGLAWLVVLGGGAVESLRSLVRGKRSWVLALLVVFAGALLLRVLLATWGPGDDQYRHGVFFRHLTSGGFRPMMDFHLGTAPEVLWECLFAVIPVTADAIVVVSLLFGSLATVLLALFLKEAGATRTAALGGAVVLATYPLAVRFSGDMARTSHVIFLAAFALWSLARHRHSGRMRDLVFFVAGTVLCCRTRPEAGMIVALAGLFVACVHLSRRSLRERWFHAEIAALFFTGVVGVGALAIASQHEASIGRELSVIQQLGGFGSFRFLTWIDRDYTSPVAMILPFFGIVAAVWLRDRTALWALLATVLLVVVLPDGHTEDLRVAYARYQGLLILSLAALSGAGVHLIDDRVRRWGNRAARWAVLAALAVALAVTSVSPLRKVCGPFTIDREYTFVHQALDLLPANARIYSPVAPLTDHVGGFRNANTIFELAGREPWLSWPLPPTAPTDRPTYVYLAPACYIDPVLLRTEYAPATSLLDRFAEALARKTPDGALTVTLPARPFANEEWTAGRLTIGFYRLR